MIVEQLFSRNVQRAVQRADAAARREVPGGERRRRAAQSRNSSRSRWRLAPAKAAFPTRSRRSRSRRGASREHGFTDGELDRAKREILAQFQRSYNERDKSESGSFAAEYLRHFFIDEVIPGIDYEYALVQWALPTITLAEMAGRGPDAARGREPGRARRRAGEAGRDRRRPKPRSRAALSSAERVAVTPWSDTTTTRALAREDCRSRQPSASRREIPELGVTVVRFANGLEAWLKPTDFKNDEILFTMYSLGGASLAAPADFLSASFATRYVGLSASAA